MSNVKVSEIRNVVFCGHGSAGKTSLVDRLLFDTGAAAYPPSVDDGTSLCDFDPEEKHHKHSIEASNVHCEADGIRFQFIDTPGYPDLIGQVVSGLSAAECAAVTINAHSGIEVNTRRVFAEATRLGLAKIIVLNKLDTENIDFSGLIDSIRELWGPQCVLLNVPIGLGADFSQVVSTLEVPGDANGAIIDPHEIHDPLIESIIEVDEAVMERYFEGVQPSQDELAQLITRAVKEGSLIPIVCCSASNGVGLPELLQTLKLCAPSPVDLLPQTSDGNPVSPDPDGPLVARVFRTRIDPYVHKLSYVRVYAGTLAKDDSLHASSARKAIKMGPLLQVQGEKTESVDHAGPGEIVAVAKMDDLHTGTSLGDQELPKIKFPTPMVGLAVSPKSHGDETKLSGALHKILEEDPTFRLDRDPQTKELVMTGMSELHLQLIQERLSRRDHLEVDTKDPKIPFRETIQADAEGSYRHKKQSGGRGQFGEIHIRMMPLPREVSVDEFATKDRFPQMKEAHYDEEHHFLWIDSVVGGVIPGNFMPAIEKGFKERLEQGVIAGFRVQDVCVEVHYGKHHPVDSSEAAFKTAARQAFRQVFEQAKPTLLEPLVHLDITVPEDHVGDVYSDMSSRGGRVQGSDPAGGNFSTIHAEAPLREVAHYSRTLSSMTGGHGSFTMDFSHYEPMPANIQQEIVSKAQLHEEDED